MEDFLQSKLDSLSFIKEKEKNALELAELFRAEDLFRFLPRRYENRCRFDSFPMGASETAICLRGKIIDAKKFFFGRRRFFQILVQEMGQDVFSEERILCRWFNLPYIHKILMVDNEVIIYGKVKEIKDQLIMDHPEFEVIRKNDSPQIHLERVVPIYRLVNGISQRRLREIIWLGLEEFSQKTKTGHSTRLGLGEDWDLRKMLMLSHFPAQEKEAWKTRRCLALEEFFVLQVGMLKRKKAFSNGYSRVSEGNLLNQFLKTLPFDFTDSQKNCISEIRSDIESSRAMNRLLQGDVGTGKTFVALAAALQIIETGGQAALMAPTQILAEQHYTNFTRWLKPLGIRIALQVSGKKKNDFLELSGDVQLVIGTHALLYGKSEWRDLGLVIIDEQHKFGVDQRLSLVQQGKMTDVLLMTATPIPRTLAMTIYGDMDVSYLREAPKGRGEVITALRYSPKEKEVANFLKEHLKQGRQAYIVYPLVEESKKLKLGSAIEEYNKWEKLLSEFSVGLLHGKLSALEKEQITRKFANGEISVLVSTTVVEVGVDVANATILLIYNADRFGLAQLHQLRGRVGRGSEKSYCILLAGSKEALDSEKLQTMKKTRDGFKIAEADLKLRGPGDLLGTEQSGLSSLRFAHFLSDADLITEARKRAEKMVSQNPSLKGKEYAWLRDRLLEFDSLFDVALL